MADMLPLSGKELQCQLSISQVMAVWRLSESCTRHAQRVLCELSDVKSSNPVGEMLQVKESIEENTIGIYVQLGKY